jgi:hypothetical protein
MVDFRWLIPPVASAPGYVAARKGGLSCICSVKANVYVDGFNLYYGLKYYSKRGRQYKWLDLAAFCQRILPRDTVDRIHYFTALVVPPPWDPLMGQRQQTYLRALQTLPSVSIHYGRFLQTYPRMPLRYPPAGTPTTVEVIKWEEKGSDVNLATVMLCEAFAGDYELAVIISNDSDLVMPIEVVRKQLGRASRRPESPPEDKWRHSQSGNVLQANR